MGPQDGVDYALRALAYLHSPVRRGDLQTTFIGSGDVFETSVLAFLDGEGIFEEFTRLVEFAQVMPGVPKIGQGVGKFSMVRTILALLDGESAFEEFTRLVEFAQVMPGFAQVGQGAGKFRMVRSMLALLDGEGIFEEFTRLVELAQITQGFAEVGQDRRELTVVGCVYGQRAGAVLLGNG
jgi:hypothetical protein